MQYIYLLLITCLFFVTSSATTLAEALEECSRTHPVAARLLKSTQNLPTDQETHPLRKKGRPSAPNSPGKTIEHVIRERAAISQFIIYLRSHMAASEDEDTDVPITPLNSRTVLHAALQKISVGEKMHFQKIAFFGSSEDKENPGEDSVILQIEIDPTMKDSKGQTNIVRMLAGKAPIGFDGRRINLHHVTQTQDSPLMELHGSTHSHRGRDLHYRKLPSLIDRHAFSLFRDHYWRWRGKLLQEKLAQGEEICWYFGSQNHGPNRENGTLRITSKKFGKG